MADKMIIDDLSDRSGKPDEEFCENKSTKWCFVTDKVMGGLSEGSLELKKEGEAYEGMTGKKLFYEEPEKPDLVINTSIEKVEESVTKLEEYIINEFSF